MLLRHTPEKIIERKGLTINPAKTCQPIGAMYAALGIHGCLPHSHGSQGCCSYHRSSLTRHYREPVMAATSSFTEGSSVFGGQANLLQAINTIFTVYEPEVIAVHSTCLSETIGDDLGQIIKKSSDDGKVPLGKHVFGASTPSYVGSHVTGFSNMVKSMVKYFSEGADKRKDQMNLIPGWVEPSDMREIKRIAGLLGIKTIMFPDTSDVLDAPLTGRHEFYPKGGTTVTDLISSGTSKSTLALGKWASEAAAIELENKCKVPFTLVDLPIGLSATDRFMMEFSRQASVQVPDLITAERGRLVDVITDMQQYFYKKKVAIVGDPDQLIPLAEYLTDLDMDVRHVVSGTPGKFFTKRIGEIVPSANVKNGAGADMFLFHQYIKNEPVDLIIGNTYCKYISRDENIPFIRFGFPILDRVGHSYFPVVGYQGALRLAEKILNSLMDKQDQDAPEYSFELTM